MAGIQGIWKTFYRKLRKQQQQFSNIIFLWYGVYGERNEKWQDVLSENSLYL